MATLIPRYKKKNISKAGYCASAGYAEIAKKAYA
jgi:hypothetical protein